jgi:hypothetical protein
MVGQDLDQRGLVLRLDQRVHRAGRQRAKRLVGRCEHGERARVAEGVGEAGGLDGRDQRGVVGGIHRVGDDGLGGYIAWPPTRTVGSGRIGAMTARAVASRACFMDSSENGRP